MEASSFELSVLSVEFSSFEVSGLLVFSEVLELLGTAKAGKEKLKMK